MLLPRRRIFSINFDRVPISDALNPKTLNPKTRNSYTRSHSERDSASEATRSRTGMAVGLGDSSEQHRLEFLACDYRDLNNWNRV